MLFIRQATTPGTRAARFPDDEDADAASLARAAAMTGTGHDHAWVSPAPAARQTALARGMTPHEVPALREADMGRWRGLPYERVARCEPEALATWLTDPHAAPHGGESLAELAARVGGWLDSMRAEPDGVAICDAGAIRAAIGHALGLDPSRTARFDLAPLSTTELTATADGWRVAHVNRKATF